jgi:hypothetical protein
LRHSRCGCRNGSGCTPGTVQYGAGEGRSLRLSDRQHGHRPHRLRSGLRRGTGGRRGVGGDEPPDGLPWGWVDRGAWRRAAAQCIHTVTLAFWPVPHPNIGQLRATRRGPRARWRSPRSSNFADDCWSSINPAALHRSQFSTRAGPPLDRASVTYPSSFLPAFSSSSVASRIAASCSSSTRPGSRCHATS